MAGTEITPKKLGQSVKRLPKENSNEEKSNEERFARQDSRRYSGWTSAIIIAVIVIVLVILIVLNQLEQLREATRLSPEAERESAIKLAAPKAGPLRN